MSVAADDLVSQCIAYVQWAVYRILQFESHLSSDEGRSLRRARQALQRRMQDAQRPLMTQAVRRRFKWYLDHLPRFERARFFTDQVALGCDACTRKVQRCTQAITLSGPRYHLSTLEQLHADELEEASEASDASSTGHSVCGEDTEDGRTFKVADFCANRAEIYHRLQHWEIATLNELHRHPSMRAALKRLGTLTIRDADQTFKVLLDSGAVKTLRRQLLTATGQAERQAGAR